MADQTSTLAERVNGHKQELRLSSERIAEFHKSFDEKQSDIVEYKKEETELVAKMTTLSKKNEQLEVHKTKIEDDKNLKMNISTLIEDKERERELAYNIKNLKRKISILEVKYDQAVKFFKRHPDKIVADLLN